MLTSKKDRLDAIEECYFIEKTYTGTIDGLVSHLVSEYELKKYSVTTIKRDIKEIKERREALDYVSAEPTITFSDLIMKDIEELFKFDSPRIKSFISSEVSQKHVHAIYFSTRKNTAPTLAKLLDNLYGTKILGTTHGDNLVILYTTSAANAEKYYKQLKKLRPKSSKSDSDTEE